MPLQGSELLLFLLFKMSQALSITLVSFEVSSEFKKALSFKFTRNVSNAIALLLLKVCAASLG